MIRQNGRYNEGTYDQPLFVSMQKIDYYMSNHPLWSFGRWSINRTEKETNAVPAPVPVPVASRAPARPQTLHIPVKPKRKVMIQIMQRNVEQNSKLQWIPKDSIAAWFIEERLLSPDCVQDADKIEKRCIEEAAQMVDDEKFQDVVARGFDILSYYKNFNNRKRMEDKCENTYRAALRNKKPNAKSTEEVEKCVYNFLKNSTMLPHEIDEIVQYCKYRHCEFERSFIITDIHGDKCHVTLTLFAYLLPEKKSPNTWRYHKGSILIQNKNHRGKYQTCRWSTEPQVTITKKP
jgi:hypothetical protein